MQKKIVISLAVVALLLIGVMASSVLATNIALANNAPILKDPEIAAKPVTDASFAPVKEQAVASLRNIESVNTENGDDSSVVAVREETNGLNEVNLESMRDAVPSTYEKTDAQLSNHRVRFLLYTHDGKHVMWGFVGNGYFVGADNNGKRCWGIYGDNGFAGFYDGVFFWGKYRSGNWKAEGLFGLNYSSGKYLLFPSPAITASDQ